MQLFSNYEMLVKTLIKKGFDETWKRNRQEDRIVNFPRKFLSFVLNVLKIASKEV